MAQTKSWLLMQAGHHAEEANRLLMREEKNSSVGEAFRREARRETADRAQAHALTSLALSALLQEVD